MNKSKWLLSRFHRYMLDRDQKMHKKGTLFCILSGGLIGLALAIMMPATITLQTQTKKCVCSRCFLYCHMVLELAAWYAFNACYSRSFSTYENFANLCGKRE